MPTRSRRAPARVTVLVTVLAAVLVASAASPAAGQVAAPGPEGQTLTVSKATALAPAGEIVTVTGSGYDQEKGIYVAYCVDNGPGQMPTPCGGGADTTGSLGASHWISSNPPNYGEGLAVPYDDGGSFSVNLTVTPTIEDVDCTERACAVVTRADHTRSADRSQDIRVPVSFGNGGPSAGEQAGPATTAGPDGASVITAGPVPTGTPVPVADELAVTRISADDSAARWWLLSTGALLAVLFALFVAGRIARRRRGMR